MVDESAYVVAGDRLVDDSASVLLQLQLQGPDALLQLHVRPLVVNKRHQTHHETQQRAPHVFRGVA